MLIIIVFDEFFNFPLCVFLCSNKFAHCNSFRNLTLYASWKICRQGVRVRSFIIAVSSSVALSASATHVYIILERRADFHLQLCATRAGERAAEQ